MAQDRPRVGLTTRQTPLGRRSRNLDNFAGRRWITIREAASYLGISVKGCYDMAASGKLPVARIGRLVSVDKVTLDSDLMHQVQGTTASIKKREGIL